MRARQLDNCIKDAEKADPFARLMAAIDAAESAEARANALYAELSRDLADARKPLTDFLEAGNA